MGKIRGKALLFIGYLVSFLRGRGVRAASLIKRRDEDVAPPGDGFGAASPAVSSDAPGKREWVVVSVCPSAPVPRTSAGKAACTGGAGTQCKCQSCSGD